MDKRPNGSPTRVRRSEDPPGQITIGEIAREFDVSLRTLRFYEDRALLVPRREGMTRYYATRDKEKLRTILRLKHLGFTLTEIRGMIADADKRHAPGALALRPDQVTAQIAHLERQRSDIDAAISTLRTLATA